MPRGRRAGLRQESPRQETSAEDGGKRRSITPKRSKEKQSGVVSRVPPLRRKGLWGKRREARNNDGGSKSNSGTTSATTSGSGNGSRSVKGSDKKKGKRETGHNGAMSTETDGEGGGGGDMTPSKPTQKRGLFGRTRSKNKVEPPQLSQKEPPVEEVAPEESSLKRVVEQESATLCPTAPADTKRSQKTRRKDPRGNDKTVSRHTSRREEPSRDTEDYSLLTDRDSLLSERHSMLSERNSTLDGRSSMVSGVSHSLLSERNSMIMERTDAYPRIRERKRSHGRHRQRRPSRGKGRRTYASSAEEQNDRLRRQHEESLVARVLGMVDATCLVPSEYDEDFDNGVGIIRSSHENIINGITCMAPDTVANEAYGKRVIRTKELMKNLSFAPEWGLPPTTGAESDGGTSDENRSWGERSAHKNSCEETTILGASWYRNPNAKPERNRKQPPRSKPHLQRKMPRRKPSSSRKGSAVIRHYAKAAEKKTSNSTLRNANKQNPFYRRSGRSFEDSYCDDESYDDTYQSFDQSNDESRYVNDTTLASSIADTRLYDDSRYGRPRHGYEG